MAIRKEQTLILVVLALAALQYRSMRTPPGRAPTYSPQKQDYAGAGFKPAVLVTPDPAVEPPSRDLFHEPAETQPLPPRPLPFPERSALSVLPVPLDPGPDAGHRHLMRVPGEGVAEPVEFGIEGGAQEAPLDDGSAEETQESEDDRLDRTYDWIDMGPGRRWHCVIEHPDKIALEAMPDWSGMELSLRKFRTSTEKLGRLETVDGAEIRKIRLAKTLRNEVDRRKRDVPEHAGNLYDRGVLIEWMLEQARTESWVYQEAAAQADLIIRLSDGDLEGFRWKVRVYREQGNFAAEYQLFQELPQEWFESPFRYEGLGLLEARLGLHADAEAHLRKAVELGPTDASARASLALFLLDRQRPRQALPHAEAAARAAGGISSPTAQARALGARVRVYLALGRFAEAEQALQEMPAGGEKAYLGGAVGYARGAYEDARAAFGEAARRGDFAAVLGVAACQLLQGRWQECKALLETVSDQAPLLRHRAQTGLALLYERTGNREEALTALDRALEADPTDPYAHYLRGRIGRRAGQLDQAMTSLEAALRLRDDLLHALAEMALCQLAKAEEAEGRAAAEHLVRAVRYIDRVVELEALAGSPSVEFLELQGLIHFQAADMRGARIAFDAGRSAADANEELYCRIGVALVDYAQGRVDDAQDQLALLQRDLPVGDPYREYAKATDELIADHSQKELLVDRFERDELGDIWSDNPDGRLRPRVANGAIRFRGQFGREEKSSAQRIGAVEQAGRILAVQVTMRLGPAHDGVQAFAGLHLESRQAAGRNRVADLEVDFGINDDEPFLLIRDARAGTGPNTEGQGDPVRELISVLPEFDLHGEQVLELRAVPRDERGQQFRLQAIWNGTVVHERDLGAVQRRTQNELLTVLKVSGRTGSEVDVTFDDYQLERRRDG